MLNTKYFIINASSNPQDPNAQKTLMAQRNPNACGNVWFVKELKMVASADEELKSLDKFSPKQICFVDKKFDPQLQNFQPSFDSTASITLTSYAANELQYKSSSPKEQLAVFSEIYYPKGWNAYVDGKLTDHFRADYVLRAMRVPAGNHNIVFKFEPETYKSGETIAGISSLLLYLFLGIGIFLELKKKKVAEQ